MATFQVTGGRVELDLPSRTEPPSAQGAARLENALSSVVAFHPKALTTYTFYEVIDQWLGPWGDRGYPIAYGKYYNVAFTSSAALMASRQGRAWVENTTVALQEALVAFIVQRYRAGTLGTLTEPELRRAAFDSHPACYDDSGLTMVAMLDPLLIFVIATIPSKEFSPWSENFEASWKQVLQAIGLTLRTGTAVGMASVMPAHSGFLRRAAAVDARRHRESMMLSQQLASLRHRIETASFDHLPWLDQIIVGLERRRFPDEGSRRAAAEVVEAAYRRRSLLRQRYRELYNMASPEVRARMRQKYPEIVDQL
jgi:hypothetical protein